MFESDNEKLESESESYRLRMIHGDSVTLMDALFAQGRVVAIGNFQGDREALRERLSDIFGEGVVIIFTTAEDLKNYKERVEEISRSL